MYEAPIIHFVLHEESTTATLSLRRGHGRSARRYLRWTIYVPVRMSAKTTPDVLRALADALEVPPTERWTPWRTEGPGSPWGDDRGV